MNKKWVGIGPKQGKSIFDSASLAESAKDASLNIDFPCFCVPYARGYKEGKGLVFLIPGVIVVVGGKKW